MSPRRTFLPVAALALAAAVSRADDQSPDNAADLYRAAAKVIVPPEDALAPSVASALDGSAAWDEARLGPHLDANRDALALFRRGAPMKRCTYDLDYSQGMSMLLPELAGMRQLGRLTSLDGSRKLALARPDEAADAWIAGLRLAAHAAEDGTVIAGLSGASIFRLNSGPLQRALAAGAFDAGTLARIQRALAAVPAGGLDWVRVVDKEREVGQATYALMLKEKNPVEFLRFLGEMGSLGERERKLLEDLDEQDPVAVNKAAQAARTLLEAAGKEHETIFRAFAVAFGKPWPEGDRAVRETAASTTHPMNKLLVDSLVATHASRARLESDRASLLATAAVQALRLTLGEYPASLDGLDLPPDPWSGKPFTLKLTAEGADLGAPGADPEGKAVLLHLSPGTRETPR